MTKYMLPAGIKARDRDANPRPYRFTDAQLAPDAPPPREPTCLRCAVTIASHGQRCDKPVDHRCDTCSEGKRGGCFLVPPEYNGRVERLLELRDEYNTACLAVGSSNARVLAGNAQVKRSGVKLARAQKAFTKAFTAHRRRAARAGEPFGVVAPAPSSTEDYLRLLVPEIRTIARSLHYLAALTAYSGEINWGGHAPNPPPAPPGPLPPGFPGGAPGPRATPFAGASHGNRGSDDEEDASSLGSDRDDSDHGGDGARVRRGSRQDNRTRGSTTQRRSRGGDERPHLPGPYRLAESPLPSPPATQPQQEIEEVDMTEEEFRDISPSVADEWDGLEEE